MEIITIINANGVLLGSVVLNDNAVDNLANTIEDFCMVSDINRADLAPVVGAMKSGCSEWSETIKTIDRNGFQVTENFLFTLNTLLS